MRRAEQRLVEIGAATGGGQPGVTQVQDTGPSGRAVHPGLVPVGVAEGDAGEQEVGPEALGGAVEGPEPLGRPVEVPAAPALEQRRGALQEFEDEPIGVGQVVVAEGDAAGSGDPEGIQHVGVDRGLPAEPAPVPVGGVRGAVDVRSVLAVDPPDVAGGRPAGDDLGVEGALEGPRAAGDNRAVARDGAEHRSQHPGGVVQYEVHGVTSPLARGGSPDPPWPRPRRANPQSIACVSPFPSCNPQRPLAPERRRRISDVTDTPLRSA
jgi:hypothetical protein